MPVTAHKKRIDHHASGWQTLGKLTLPIGVSPDDTVNTWLTEILNTLNLSTEFFERFLRSVQASAARAMEVNTQTQDVHVHISILVPHKHDSIGRSWGFFQIEKIETKVNDAEHIHTIDFYLYVEGD